jgi:hypothetical protein
MGATSSVVTKLYSNSITLIITAAVSKSLRVLVTRPMRTALTWVVIPVGFPAVDEGHDRDPSLKTAQTKRQLREH